MNQEPTIGQYLLQRLSEEGVRHIFGVPGDYVLGLYDLLSHHKHVIHIGTTREDTAAFAADGYARCHGLGALIVTYGVGALNVVNSAAGAYAESSPVVIISGAPGLHERQENPLLHHRFGPYSFQREIFERITCATAVLDDPLIALRQIDRTLQAAQVYCKPVYIEVPRDQIDKPGYRVPTKRVTLPSSDPGSLQEAVEETLEHLAKASNPVLLAGVEVHRRSLQDALVKVVEQARLPVAATLTGKSVVGERHPAYIGIYEGAMGVETTRQRVESADLLLLLGVTLNDVDLGIFTARLDPNRMIRASQGEVIIRHHRYTNVYLRDYIPTLAAKLQPTQRQTPDPLSWSQTEEFPHPGRPMTVARLIERLNDALTPDMMVISDTGDCLFAALELRVFERTEFIASAFYTTMGFAVPAALGAQMARPDRRALILVGDGAFQMTGTELATHARLGLNPIIIVFNNKGYSTERFILDGPFNDISSWNFERLGEIFGPLQGYIATTEDEFESAIQQAIQKTDMPCLINVHLRSDDASPAMRRLAEHLKQRVKG